MNALLVIAACSSQDAADKRVLDDTAMDTETEDTAVDTETEDTAVDTETDDTGSTLDTADEGKPLYDCGEAPAGAIEIELTSYFDADQYFYNSAANGSPWGWYLSAEGTDSFAETCDPAEAREDYLAGSGYNVRVTVTMPAAYPPSYLGEYFNPAAPRGPVPGVRVTIYYLDDEGALQISGTGSDDADASILCLSRVRPTRVSGTFTYLATLTSRLPQNYFVKFDFVAQGDFTDPDWREGGWDDGTCMNPAIYWSYDDPEDVWRDAYWESLAE